MNELRYFLIIIIQSVLIMFSADAHPQLDYPTGGEVFQAGSQITIEWHIAIEHEQEDWDLYFSPDGGQTWKTIEEDMPISTMEYHWTVPDISTQVTQIRIVMDNVEGESDYEDICQSFTIIGSDAVTGIASGENKGTISFFSNFPNPFRTSTKINFTIKGNSFIKISVYDIQGKKVATLINKELHSGDHEINWMAEGISSGIYICKLQVGDRYRIRKIILLR